MTKYLPSKKTITGILISLVVVMLFYHSRIGRMFSHTTDSPVATFPVTLTPGENLTQQITGLDGYINGFSIQFETYDQVQDAAVDILLSVNGEPAARTTLYTSSLKNQAFQAVYFPEAVRVHPSDPCTLTLCAQTGYTGVVGAYTSAFSTGLTGADGSAVDAGLCYQTHLRDAGSAGPFSVLIALHILLLLFAAIRLFGENNLRIHTWLVLTLAGLLYVSVLTDDLFWGNKLKTDISVPVKPVEAGTYYLEPSGSWETGFRIIGRRVDSLMIFPEFTYDYPVSGLHVKLEHAATGAILLDRTVQPSDLVCDHQTGDYVLKWHAASEHPDAGFFPAGDYVLTLSNSSAQTAGFRTTQSHFDADISTTVLTAQRSLGIVFYWLFGLALLLFSVYLCVLSVLYEKKALTPARFFLVSAITFSAFYLLVNKPSGVTDSEAHFLATYRYASILRGEDATSGRTDDVYYYENVFWEGSAPATLSCFHPFIERDAHIPFLESNKEMDTYSIFCYLPQVIGMLSAFILHLGTVPMLYLSRLFITVFYIGAVYHAIRITPVGKHLFLCVALFPGALRACTSFSYDAMVQITCICFLANVLRLYANPDTKKFFYETLLWTFLLGAVKGGGYLILLPVILMLTKKEKSRFLKQGMILLCGLVSVFLFDVALVGGARLYQFGDTAGNYTTEFALHNPAWYLGMMIRTYATQFDDLFLTVASGRNATSGLALDIVLCSLFLFTGLLALLEQDEPLLKKKDQLVLAFTVLVFLVSIPPLMLKDTPVGAEVINGIRGRYYTPMLIPAFLACTKFRLKQAIATPEESRSGHTQRVLLWFSCALIVCAYFFMRQLQG